MSKEPIYIMNLFPTLDDLRPYPIANKKDVLEYLHKFKPKYRAGGFFTDIKNGQRYPTNPSDCLEAYTDGEWCWDTELIHYFETYDAKLDDRFLIKFA